MIGSTKGVEKRAGTKVQEGAAEKSSMAFGDGSTVNDTEKSRAEYETALANRDASIIELEGLIAEAAENAEKLRAEMDVLRRQEDEQRMGFELQMAGCRNVKAVRALLDDHGGDIAALKEAEPSLFEGSSAPKQTGKTGLPKAGAASGGGKTMKRQREIVGIADEEQRMTANSIAAVKNYTTILDEVYQRAVVSRHLSPHVNSLHDVFRCMAE